LTTDTIGTTAATTNGFSTAAIGYPITASASGALQTIGINLSTPPTCNIALAIYSDNSGTPNVLLGYSASSAAVNGWNDLSVIGVPIFIGVTYWLVMETDDITSAYFILESATGMDSYKLGTSFGTFPNPYAASGSFNRGIMNMRMSYSLPPAYDSVLIAM
jgi:hypothetical protein